MCLLGPPPSNTKPYKSAVASLLEGTVTIPEWEFLIVSGGETAPMYEERSYGSKFTRGSGRHKRFKVSDILALPRDPFILGRDLGFFDCL
jgi:hypothetical protein